MAARMEELVTALKRVRHHKWWQHESVLSRKLGIQPKEGPSVRDQLSSLLECLKKGYTGLKRHESYKVLSCGKVVFSNDASNAFKMRTGPYGGKEAFLTNSLDSVSVRLFNELGTIFAFLCWWRIRVVFARLGQQNGQKGIYTQLFSLPNFMLQLRWS